MFTSALNQGMAKTTSHKVVLPFYLYASFSFVVSTSLLLFSAAGFTQHHFQPHTLAITHIMALGWGTMIILGASHQLVPVLIEGRMYSDKLAYISFGLAGVGIPLLAYGFYVFNMGWPAQWGGWLVIMAVVAYIINLGVSMARSGRENVHAVFVFTASLWLLATTTFGLILVYNLTMPLLSGSSLDYLPVHAHLGIVGWFLLLVTGVGSRLIPMFLISKYNNTRQLWWVYGLINGGLLSFVFSFLYTQGDHFYFFPIISVAAGILLFGFYCYRSYLHRIRRKVDEQMKLSLLSVLMMLMPLVFLVVIIGLLVMSPDESIPLANAYGFVVFFGWITAIILGMTFKTLPFIVWNKVYHHLAGKGQTPNPKDLFSNALFKWMIVAYLPGFLIFTAGILIKSVVLLPFGAALLLIASFLYTWNVVKILGHKAA